MIEVLTPLMLNDIQWKFSLHLQQIIKFSKTQLGEYVSSFWKWSEFYENWHPEIKWNSCLRNKYIFSYKSSANHNNTLLVQCFATYEVQQMKIWTFKKVFGCLWKHAMEIGNLLILTRTMYIYSSSKISLFL